MLIVILSSSKKYTIYDTLQILWWIFIYYLKNKKSRSSL